MTPTRGSQHGRQRLRVISTRLRGEWSALADRGGLPNHQMCDGKPSSKPENLAAARTSGVQRVEEQSSTASKARLQSIAVNYDLIIIGGNPAGLSLAAESQEAGLQRVLVLEPSSSVTPFEAVGRYRLEVRYGVNVHSMSTADEGVLVETNDGPLTASAVAYAEVPAGEPIAPDYPVPGPILRRVHVGGADLVPDEAHDVLVVGGGEQAVECAQDASSAGHQVVLSLTGSFDQLSRLSQETLTSLETGRHATIFWHTSPSGLDNVGGYPMAVFGDRRTPDLQFDHVVYALGIDVADDAFAQHGMTVDVTNNRLFILQDRNEHIHHSIGMLVPAGGAWTIIRQHAFDHLPEPLPLPPPAKAEELRERHYNATITRFDKTHSDLWRIAVRPDVGDAAHRAGQYATLGLGYWESRIDAAADQLKEGQAEKLVRRSYSISSPIFDDHHYLSDPHDSDELEFYIVLVPPSVDRVPALTPRLARKTIGDRIYLGPRISGRYTLGAVTDPASTVIFLSTGTGEAPHNAMASELLRKGHHGPVIAAISARMLSDLAYLDEHRQLEERFSNYHYVTLPTREPGVPKRYIQDALTDGTITAAISGPLEPVNTHVFLCGNPAMIGPPTWDGDQPVFAGERGAVEILTEMGFQVDRRDKPGNIHFEEYW